MWFLLFISISLISFSSSTMSTISDLVYTNSLRNLNCGCDRRRDRDVSKIVIHAYNFDSNINASYNINEAANEILTRKDFDSNQCIHIYVPGFLGTENNGGSETTKCIVSQIRCNDKKPLVLIVNHSKYTSPTFLIQNINEINMYKRAVSYVKPIGVRLGKFVAELLTKMKRNNIEIMGHSLGGQIIGSLGQTVKDITGTPLKSLYAIDPAGPCFDNCPQEHIRKGQADMTVSFHCNAGQLGSYQNLTDYDFYSNGGVIQEGCESTIFDAGVFTAAKSSICSHFKCVPIAQNPAIRTGIWESVKCDSEREYVEGSCGNNPSTYSGYTITPSGDAGIYFLHPGTDLMCEL